MVAIKIVFPKSGRKTSTWVPDEEWRTLSKQQQGALVYRFIKNHFARELAASKAQSPDTPNYRWSEI